MADNALALAFFVDVDSHVPSDPHFSIFCDWQGLMVIPLVSTLYHYNCPNFPDMKST